MHTLHKSHAIQVSAQKNEEKNMSYIPGSVLEVHVTFKKLFEIMSTFTHEDMVERGISEKQMWKAYYEALDKAYSDYYAPEQCDDDELELDLLYSLEEERLYSPSTHDDLEF